MIQKIAWNAFLLTSSQVIARLIGLLYFVFLARSLGVEAFGIYTFTLAFLYNFIPIADFGIERLVLKDISKEPTKASLYFSQLLIPRVLLAVIAIFIALLAGIILHQSFNQIIYFLVFGLSLIPYNLTYLITAIQNAKEKMKYSAIANIAIIGVTSVLGVIFVLLGLSLLWIFLAYFLGNLIVALVFLIFSPKFGLNLKIKIDLEFWKEVIKKSWVFAVIIILAVFYLRLSVIMVGLLMSAYDVGLYGAVFKFIESSLLIPQALALVLFPVTARLFEGDKNKLLSLYRNGILSLLVLVLPFTLVFIFLSRLLIEVIYGKEYLLSAPVLSVLGISLIFFFLNSLPGNIIQNSPKLKKFLPFAFLNFLTTLIFCLILIPKYGIIGAAWAVLFGELAGFLINNYFVWKILK